MTILILHGIGGAAGIHWQGWLHDELVKKGQTVIMPTLPDTDHPRRAIWRQTILKLVRGIPPEDLILVGHSLGVTSALDFLENTEGKIRALFSVSGFGEDYGAELNSYFLRERHISYDRVKAHVRESFVIYGDHDPYVPQTTLKHLADKLEVQPIIIENGGHVNTEAGYAQLPLLLETISPILEAAFHTKPQGI